MGISKDATVAVVGLGYVGLPLAVEFGRLYRTIGFDLSEAKIANYRTCWDPTGQVTSEDLGAVLRPDGLQVTTDPALLAAADYIVVAVPTPVDEAHIPDFSPLVGASITVGRHMKAGATVIYESTVYPGATEEVCIPVLERESGFTWKADFHVGYSPERVNPGDKDRTITKIVKVVSGDDQATLDSVSSLYGSIITAGVHPTRSIKVAEAAKVIENTQRDLNIALMNELAIIFHKLGIDSSEVLEAAGTKWNFLKFKPGLVGGHCIGVDPYYLTHKAEMMGYHPQVILAGRRINDGMAAYVAQQAIKKMINLGTGVKGAKVVVLGLTFKENCPDLRNSKVFELISEFREFGCDVYAHDPIADPQEAMHEFGVELLEWQDLPVADALVVAVAHEHYVVDEGEKLREKIAGAAGLFVDVKAAFPDDYWHNVWRL